MQILRLLCSGRGVPPLDGHNAHADASFTWMIGGRDPIDARQFQCLRRPDSAVEARQCSDKGDKKLSKDNGRLPIQTCGCSVRSTKARMPDAKLFTTGETGQRRQHTVSPAPCFYWRAPPLFTIGPLLDSQHQEPKKYILPRHPTTHPFTARTQNYKIARLNYAVMYATRFIKPVNVTREPVHPCCQVTSQLGPFTLPLG